ncbi:hypothetical protein [Actinophytocola sp. NPDC049390]|uniref:hypothetical protein n=1 Tax=Actinophytocola sp. NPDC049390 TaxID=3363894 RepID=UPI0037B9690F
MTEQGEEPTPTKKLGGVLGPELIFGAATPITVVTALLVHVGSVRNRSYYGYFGVDQDLLSPSVQDYVMRSVDVTFGAVLRLVAAGLVLIVLDRVLVWLLRTRNTADRLTKSLVAAGAVLSVVGLLAALGVAGGFGIPPLAAAAVLAVGVGVVLRLGPSLFAGRSVALGLPTTIALYTVLVVALFWAATLYAHDLGRRAARVTEANPAGLPVVTVFSEEYLDLPGDQVQATPVTDPAGHVHYRYSGMSLLTYSNGTWFLITGRYSQAYRPSVLVLRDSGAVRVEVAAPEPQDS